MKLGRWKPVPLEEIEERNLFPKRGLWGNVAGNWDLVDRGERLGFWGLESYD